MWDGYMIELVIGSVTILVVLCCSYLLLKNQHRLLGAISNESEIFSNDLLRQQLIATCPGSYFGKNGEGFVRFCFANSKKNIYEAVDRMRKNFNS